MSNQISDDVNVPAISGENTAGGFGIKGKGGVGVHGDNEGGNIGPDRGAGVWGESQNGFGVFGSSDHHRGVRGVSKHGIGINGINEAPAASQPDRGCGVHGEAVNGYGVLGVSDNWDGVRGVSNNGIAVLGQSQNNAGVHGETHSSVFAAVAGIQLNPDSTGAAIYGEHKGNRLAGFFKGDVEVTGDIRLVNADCAEDFDVTDAVEIEPGTVMVLSNEGELVPGYQAYDKRVAGVISGAGHYKPGIVLDKQPTGRTRKPVALLGKVFCKVDAQYGAIEVGDLLTTSPTIGHAMKAENPNQAFGAVIGKALRPFHDGQGLVPILITLQ